jgi:ribulose-phosphate 3-epimerase
MTAAQPAIRIAPSILSANFARLGEDIARIESGGADLVHVDVMDGHFVPNITIGPPVVAAVKKVTKLPLDVHLMISEPDRYLEAFVAAGASMITVHAEVLPHLHRTLTHIRHLGAKAGVALNPSTPIATIGDVIAQLDHVLVMSVNPGFGGQSFIPRTFERLDECRLMLQAAGSTAAIEVDGGVDAGNAAALVARGVTILVAGNAIFAQPDPAEATRQLRRAAGAGR